MPRILEVLKEIAPTVDTVISVGVSTRCDEQGGDPLRDMLRAQGFEAWRAKINLGMGRHTNPPRRTEEVVSS